MTSWISIKNKIKIEKSKLTEEQIKLLEKVVVENEIVSNDIKSIESISDASYKYGHYNNAGICFMINYAN